jgi:excisionase family DNA binding protein
LPDLHKVAEALTLHAYLRTILTCMTLIDVQRRLLTVSDVAERLGVSRRTVERKIKLGEIPALQLGGNWSPIRVDERELEEWLYRDAEAAE